MYSKAKIYNLALGALLLQRQIIDVDTDKSNEAKVLNTHWETALYSTLEDLNLDSMSETVTLELVEEEPNDLWKYAYKYPSNCAFLRRLVSCTDIDTRDTQIRKRVGRHEGQKVIFTDEPQAKAEIIPKDIDLDSIESNTAMAIAYKLAMLSAPLATGKGAQRLIESIMQRYAIHKAEAQERDKLENENFEDPRVESDFVRARME